MFTGLTPPFADTVISWERKFQGAKVPRTFALGRESSRKQSSRERQGHGTKAQGICAPGVTVPESESCRE